MNNPATASHPFEANAHDASPSARAIAALAAGDPGLDELLNRMAGEVKARLDEVELRHANALREMQIKLGRMAGEAERARPAIPSELAIAFGRIEAGMADLVDRIAETAPERPRKADAFVFGAPKLDTTAFVFDPPSRTPIAPISLSGADSAEPWDQTSAEALAHLYESGEAALAQLHPEHLPSAALFASAHRVREAATDAPTQPVETSTSTASTTVTEAHAVAEATPVAPIAPMAPDDRDWLSQRFAAIADQMSETARGFQQTGTLDLLLARVDAFESRFTEALDHVASKIDLSTVRADAFEAVETQLRDLAVHIESTQMQFTRLDAVEQHLADLTAFARHSMETALAEPSHAVEPPSQVDFGTLADLAVDRALARLPAAVTPLPTDGQTRIADVQALLETFIAERRHSDQTTTETLETMQEALIRLIDRLDTLDGGPGLVPAAHAAPLSPEVPQVAVPPTVVPDVERANSRDATPIKTIRRRDRRLGGLADLTIDKETPAVGSLDDVAAEQAEPTIPAASVDGATARSKRPGVSAGTAAVLPNPNAGKRGMMVAAAALSLVVVSYVASLLFESQFEQPALISTANGTPAAPARIGPSAPVPAGPVPSAPASSAPLPRASGSTDGQPGGMVGAPQRPAAALPANVPAGMVEPNRPAPPNADGRPASSKPASPAANPQNFEYIPNRPASVPETAIEDLSAADVAGPNAQAQNVQPQNGQQAVGGALAGRPTAALPALPGMAVAVMPQPPRADEFALAQHQAAMAAASERAGANAVSAEAFSQRYARRPAAATSPLVTGSTQPLRGQAVAPRPEFAPVAAFELPPAIVGPLSLRLAASKGDPSATFEVATRLAEGRVNKQDFPAALVWYQRAAEKGLAVAQYRLGTLYERGLGAGLDIAKAQGWYQRAAEQGNVRAMHNLAVLSASNGPNGPDYATAAKWFAVAADHGLADSQFNLAMLSENGLGVQKDPANAYFWYSIAARSGDPEAARRRDKLLASLDRSLLVTADERVQTWRARLIDSKINDARVAGDLWRNQATADAGAQLN